MIFTDTVTIDTDYFTVTLTAEALESIPMQGRADAAVAELVAQPWIVHAFRHVADADLVRDLEEYGAWEPAELLDRKVNIERVLWLAGVRYQEKREEEEEEGR